MAVSERTTTHITEALIVTFMVFGMFIILSLQSVFNNFVSAPFSDDGLLGLAVMEIILAVSAITFLHVRGFAVATLLPVPTAKGGAVGIMLFFVAWFIGQLLISPFAADQPQQPIQAMLADAQVSLPFVVIMAMINGAFEEIFLLGFLFRGLQHYGLSIALGITLLIRVLCHLYQGPLGPIWVIGFGLTFALYYRRSSLLWPPVFAHILWDIVPFILTESPSS